MKTYPHKPVSAFETPHRRGEAHLSILRLDILEPNVPQIHREIMLCAQASASRSRSPSSQPTQERMKKKAHLVRQLVRHLPHLPLLLQDPLTHLVQRRLDTRRVVRRERLERRALDRGEDVLKVDPAEGGEGGESERGGRGEGDCVGAFDGGAEDAVFYRCSRGGRVSAAKGGDGDGRGGEGRTHAAESCTRPSRNSQKKTQRT